MKKGTHYTHINTQEVEKLQKYMETQPKLIILTHMRPDEDAIGSASALYMGLKSLGMDVDVACIDPVPENCQFLSSVDEFLMDFDPSDYDGVFFTDCGDGMRTGFHNLYPEILGDTMVKLNLDHHASNDNFGEINFVSTKAASATQIVTELFDALDVKIIPTIATSLLAGLYTDTGSFRHSNVDADVLATASYLVHKGGQVQKIAKNIFQTYSFRTVKFWGKILETLHITDDGAAIVGVEQEEFDSVGATKDDLADIIDYVNAMPEAKYSVLLTEDGKGNVKASLRTRRDDIDVNALAKKFGGGGHVKASGFMIKDSKLKKELKWKIVQDQQKSDK